MNKRAPWVTRFQFGLGATVLYVVLTLVLLDYAGMEPLGPGGSALVTMGTALVVLTLGFGARAVYELGRRRRGRISVP